MAVKVCSYVLCDPDVGALVAALTSTAAGGEGPDKWGRILSDLHPKQRDFVLDTSRRKCALKGRRGGGSWGTAAWLLQDWWLAPGQMSLFIAQSKEHAKAILWPTLEQMNERYSLGLKFNGLDLFAAFPNGYRVLLRGAKDRVQVEKLRGFASGCRNIAIDESGSFGGHDKLFRYLVGSVLSPQLMDHRHEGGGGLALVGSPGMDPIGLFYERTTGRTHMGEPAVEWSTHHWTALDNPYVDASGYFTEELRAGGHILDDSEPEELVAEFLRIAKLPRSQQQHHYDALAGRISGEFRREYLAQWVRDRSGVVYLYDPARHALPPLFQLTPGVWRIVIGCDIGWEDGNGFCVAAKRADSPEVYVLEAYYKPELGTAQIAEELKTLRQRYRTGEIYVDTGGEGGRLLVDLEHYGVLALKAGKGPKKPRIEYARALLDSGTLRVVERACADLLTEWTALPWDELRKSHREGFVDDVTDAFLMAVNPLSQRYMPPPPPRPEYGSDEWRRAQDERERQLAVRAGKRHKKKRFLMAA